MDSKPRGEIDHILEHVHSINDLDQDTIAELRFTLEGRFAIEKFEVSELEFSQWLDENYNGDRRGIEYDSQQKRVVIKAVSSEVHRVLAAALFGWFGSIAERFRSCTRSNYYRSIGSISFNLSGAHEGSRKELDAGIRHTSDDYPIVALEIAVSKPKSDVFRDANQWLEGSNGKTKLVVVVDIQENLAPVEDRTQTAATAWGLSDREILNHTYETLRNHVFRWNYKRKISLVGEFEAGVYFCFPKEEPRLILEYAYSLDDPQRRSPVTHDKCSFSSKPFLPKLDYILEFPLPIDTFTRTMRNGVRFEGGHRAEVQAWKKIKEVREMGTPDSPRDASDS